MYYVTSRKHAHGDMIIWQHVKKLRGFKAEDGVEYLVAKNKKEMNIEMGTSLPIYIGREGKLKKTTSYAVYLF